MTLILFHAASAAEITAEKQHVSFRTFFVTFYVILFDKLTLSIYFKISNLNLSQGTKRQLDISTF